MAKPFKLLAVEELFMSRYSQSIDVGKDLEQEKEPGEENQAEESGEAGEQVEEQPPEGQKQEQTTNAGMQAESQESVVQDQPAVSENTAANELMDDSSGRRPELDESKPVDPVEEDVAEIITKDVPVLEQKKKFSLNPKLLFVVVLILLLVAWRFWLVGDEQAKENSPAVGEKAAKNNTMVVSDQNDSEVAELRTILAEGLKD